MILRASELRVVGPLHFAVLEKVFILQKKKKKRVEMNYLLELLFESVTVQAGASPARSPEAFSKLDRDSFPSMSSFLCHVYPSVSLT